MMWFPYRSRPPTGAAGGVVLLKSQDTHDYEDLANYAELAPLPPQRIPLSLLRADTDKIEIEASRNPAYTTTQGQRSAAVEVVGSEYEEIPIVSEAQGERSTRTGPKYEVSSEGQTQIQSQSTNASEYEEMN